MQSDSTNRLGEQQVKSVQPLAGPRIPMAAIAPNAGIARQTFEAENNVLQLDSADELFRYDEAAQRQVDSLKPWRSDPRYFKQCVPLETLCHACALPAHCVSLGVLPAVL